MQIPGGTEAATPPKRHMASQGDPQRNHVSATSEPAGEHLPRPPAKSQASPIIKPANTDTIAQHAASRLGEPPAKVEGKPETEANKLLASDAATRLASHPQSAQQYPHPPQDKEKTASKTPETPSLSAKPTAESAKEGGKTAARVVSEGGKAAAHGAVEGGKAMETGTRTASQGMAEGGKVMETGGKAAWSAAKTITEGGAMAAKAVEAGGRMAKGVTNSTKAGIDVAGAGAKAAKQATEAGTKAAKQTAEVGGKVASSVASTMGEGGKAVGDAAAVTAEAAKWSLNKSLQAVTQVFSITWSVTAWFVVGAASNMGRLAHAVALACSTSINKCADVLLGLMLHNLKRVNTSIDHLVVDTPDLIRSTLTRAKAAKMAKEGSQQELAPQGPEMTGHDSGTREEHHVKHKQEPQEEDISIAGDMDVARSANDALHRLFDREGSNREALVNESHKLAWHVWMLVALQVTAVRSVLQVTEGVISWGVSAWWQLATAAVLLTVMLSVAPLAATAAVLAWTCHFLLKQVLWVQDGLDRAHAYIAPTMHKAMSGLRHTLEPHLGPEGQKLQGGGMLTRYMENSKALARAWLDVGEKFTTRVLSTLSAEGHEQAKEGEKVDAPHGRQSSLSAACSDAQEAWQKASALTNAAAATVLDVCRVLLLGLATRLSRCIAGSLTSFPLAFTFDLPVLKWMPRLYSAAGGQGTLKDPDVKDFIEIAGTGQTTAE